MNFGFNFQIVDIIRQEIVLKSMEKQCIDEELNEKLFGLEHFKSELESLDIELVSGSRNSCRIHFIKKHF